MDTKKVWEQAQHKEIKKMKKLFLTILFLMAISCTTMPIEQQVHSKWSEIFNLQPGIATETDVQKLLGPPSKINKRADESINWIYNTSNTNLPLLVFGFHSSKTLYGIAWLPVDNDHKLTLEEAKERFKGAQFTKTVTDLSGTHYYSFADDYTDSKQGIVIRYNNGRIEHISKFDPSLRLPADSKKAKPSSK